MTILLLRHAEAGDRSTWAGDDRHRPTDRVGREQAAAIVEQYAGRPIDRILTSPYTRCVQTVEPLAADRGLLLEEEEDLAEGAPFDAVQRLLRQLDGTNAVLCTHGDVVAAVVADLRHRGADLPDDPRCQKAGTWVLDGDPGRPVAAYLAPAVRP